MNADSFDNEYSYKLEGWLPCVDGSTSAEEDSTSHHKEVWMLFNTIVLSSHVLDIKDC